MKKILIIMIALVCSLGISAQEQKKQHRPFDPQKFEQSLEQYVIQKAGITQAETTGFLPIFREMRKKEVEIMQKGRKAVSGKPKTEQEWEQKLREHDNAEIQLKKIQQTYHIRLLKVLPASKIVKMTRAEEEFHREAFKQIHANHNGQGNHRRGHQNSGNK